MRIRVYQPVFMTDSMGIGVGVCSALVGVANGLQSCVSLVYDREIEMAGESRECC